MEAANETSMITSVVFLGPESTYKSTLVKNIASHCAVPYLPEVTRYYTNAVLKHKKRYLNESDVLKIARLEQKQYYTLQRSLKNTSFIIQDTDALSTLVYTKYYYKNFNTSLLNSFINTNNKIYILTYPDVPFVSDGVRDHNANRKVLFNMFKAQLDFRQLKYSVVSGSLEQRFAQSINFINKNIL